MIKLKRGRLRWSDEDMVVMARVLGPEAAAKGQITPIDSVLYEARRQGVILSKKTARLLDQGIRERKALRRIRKADDVIPSGYNSRLSDMWTHQRIALGYMDRLPAYLLSDQVGVGKTAVAILWAEKRMRQRTLVIVRNSAKYQWADAIASWSVRNHEISILEGRVTEQNEQAQRNGWVIAHWESLVHAREGLLDREWDVVIADEAHWMRNRDTERASTAFILSQMSDFRMALTAHPFNKSPAELYSILSFLYPQRYTSFWSFFSMHVLGKPKPFGGWDIKGTRNPKLLRWEIEPFHLRRTKRQVRRNLPAVTEIPRYLELPSGHSREYKQIQKLFFAELKTKKGSRILAIPSILARVTRMRQYLLDPEILGGKKKSIKYPEVLSIMEEMDGPPVIFTTYRQAAVRLRSFLKKHGKETRLIAGGIDVKKREQIRKNFLKGKYDAVIMTSAGTESLNFGKYGYMIMLDMPFTWLEYDQAVGRVDRPEEGTGNTVPTTVYRIVTKGTYEERVEKLVLKERKSMFEEVFTPDELMEIFS